MPLQNPVPYVGANVYIISQALVGQHVYPIVEKVEGGLAEGLTNESGQITIDNLPINTPLSCVVVEGTLQTEGQVDLLYDRVVALHDPDADGVPDFELLTTHGFTTSFYLEDYVTSLLSASGTLSSPKGVLPSYPVYALKRTAEGVYDIVAETTTNGSGNWSFTDLSYLVGDLACFGAPVNEFIPAGSCGDDDLRGIVDANQDGTPDFIKLLQATHSVTNQAIYVDELGSLEVYLKFNRLYNGNPFSDDYGYVAGLEQYVPFFDGAEGLNGAYYFPNSGATYVIKPTDADVFFIPSSGAFTMEFRFKLVGSAGNVRLFSFSGSDNFRGGTTNATGYYLHVAQTGADLCLRANVSTYQTLSFATPISTDVYHHLAVVIDRSDQSVRFYLDGTLVGTDTITIGLSTHFGNGRFMLGRGYRVGSEGGIAPALCYIDEFRVWSSARSEAEIGEALGVELSL